MKSVPDWVYGVAALGFFGLTWTSVCTVLAYVLWQALRWAAVADFTATVAALVVWACLLLIGGLTLVLLLRDSARAQQSYWPRY